jgi:hypothetical protein
MIPKTTTLWKKKHFSMYIWDLRKDQSFFIPGISKADLQRSYIDMLIILNFGNVYNSNNSHRNNGDMYWEHSRQQTGLYTTF